MQEERSESPHVLLVFPAGSESRGMLEALGEIGASLERADHVFTAISRFTARPADVVILGLAGLDDRDVERALPLFRELRPDVHILLAFPPRRRESAVRALALGADAYVLEPFYLGELVDLVRRGLERTGSAAAGDPALDDEGMEKLAGAIGHAINNRLQVIELQLEQEEIEPAEIRQETTGIAAVAEELLAYARREQGRPVSVDLGKLLKKAVPLTGNRRHHVTRELADGLPDVAGDEGLLHFAFESFALLADVRDPGGRLSVTSRQDGPESVEVRFHAPDVLLTAAEQRDLFRPHSSVLGGEVGLRAAAAKGIILSHGGEVGLGSREGEGTTVVVRLPASA